MDNSSFLLVLLLWFGSVACKEVGFKDCGSVSGKPTHVDITPCNSSPCSFQKGTNVTVSISFTPNGVVNSLKASVAGIVAGMVFPFPLPRDDGCNDSGLTCPLKGGVEVTFKKILEVPSGYPPVHFLAKWELKDENKQDVVCLEVESRIL